MASARELLELGRTLPPQVYEPVEIAIREVPTGPEFAGSATVVESWGRLC
jgi:hypothetical protein